MALGMRLRLAAAAFACVALATPLAAVRPQQNAQADGVLPDFDIRSSRAPAAPAGRAQTEAARTRGANGDARVRIHPHTGAVRVLEAPGITIPRGLQPAALVTLTRSLTARLGLDDGDLDNLTLARDYVSRSTGLRHVVLAQVVDGLPVFDGAIAIHLDQRGRVVRITSGAGRAAGRQRTPQVAPEQAVEAAASDIRAGEPFAAVRIAGTADPGGTLRFARGPFVSDPTASQMWFPMDGVLRLAWKVSIEPQGPSQLYDLLIDAQTGELLLRQNRVRYAEGSGRVAQSDAMNVLDPRRLDPMPKGAAGCPPALNYQLRSLNAPFRDPATVLFNTGTLNGNNAHVFRRAAPAEGANGTFDGTAWGFDFPFNSDASAATALFFALNFAHDFFYDLGFDEAAGNFQVDNFGRGGLGNDSMRGNARAAGRNNANYVHAVDGSSGTINMYLWDGMGCWAQDVNADGTPDLDGDYDFDIIIHEYHHGVSLRINDAFTGNEAGAIGEGGGDFFAYSVNGNPLLAEYARPGGLRGVNAKTYAEWFCLLGLICEVHDNGEIWANVLWDLRERFRTDLVRGTEAGAINEAHQLYIDGLKLSPPAPTMLDMRDAILQADTLRNPGSPRSANFCRVWEVFAGRGMGANATDTADNGFNRVGADTSVPAGCAAPPAPPTVTIAVTTPTATEAGLVPGALTVGRGTASSDPLTVSYTVTGTATGGVDYVALSGSAVIPANELSVVVPVEPLDDAIVETNETVIVTLRPSATYVLGAQTAGTVTIVSDDVAPDLTVTALTAPPGGAAGGTLQVTDTTNNQGAGAAAASITSFYLSKNTILDAGDTFVGSRPVPALNPSTASTATSILTVPASVEPGTYTLFAKADDGAAVTEGNEANNTRIAFLQIGPDLIVSALSAPASAGAGVPFSVTENTMNQGRAAAPETVTRFFLSTNVSFEPSDTPLQSRAVPALAAGTVSTATTTVTLPAATPDGTYYLIARADGLDTLPEASETNNTRSFLIRVGADLTVTSLTPPARAAAGTTIGITDITQNIGGGAAPASVTAFYLSANTVLDAGDTRLAPTRAVDPLAGGVSSTKTTTVRLPNVAAGTWYIFANADDERTVQETQEQNNVRFASILIGPDLTISSWAPPTTATAGSTLTVTDSVRNIGAADAGPSVTRFYLSTNLLLDAGDIPIGPGRDVPAVAAGQTNTGTTMLTLPAGLTGSFFLFAVSDGNGNVAEASESNNSAARVIQINPGL